MQTTKKIDNSLPSIGIIFNKFIQKYNILDIIPYLIFYIETIYTQNYEIIFAILLFYAILQNIHSHLFVEQEEKPHRQDNPKHNDLSPRNHPQYQGI